MSDSFNLRMRPERLAGGFAKDDSVISFYTRIAMLLKPDFTVLDYGAGRGARYENIDKEDQTYSYKLTVIRGKVKKVVGVDVDPAVFNNKGLDEAFLIGDGGILPFPDESFDLIYSDWVLEHVENPESIVAELRRVLKIGGWICARTPHAGGYIGLGARLIPEFLHGLTLRKLQSGHHADDKFKKFYRMNTLSALNKYFPSELFNNVSYSINTEPAYHGNRVLLYKLLEIFQSIPLFRTLIFVLVQRKK